MPLEIHAGFAVQRWWQVFAGEWGGMGYYVLLYDVVDDYVTRRASFRQEHLKLAADAHARGEIVMGGAFADPANKVLIVFRGEDRSVAESFARKDPYVINGLVTHWEVRPWTVVIGGADTVPPASPKP